MGEATGGGPTEYGYLLNTKATCVCSPSCRRKPRLFEPPSHKCAGYAGIITLSFSPRSTMISIGAALAGIVLLWFLRSWYEFEVMKAKLRAIPTVGSSNFFTYPLVALRFMMNGHNMPLLSRMTTQHPNSAFKIRTPITPSGWLVLGTGHQFVEDLRRASTEQLSFFHAAGYILGAPWLNGNRDADTSKPHHFDAVRVSLTRSFPSRFEDIRDEIEASVSDSFGLTQDWNEIVLFKALVSVVTRTSNRLFVGLPLCRDKEFLQILQTLAIKRAVAGNAFQFLPGFLKPHFGRLISPIATAIKQLEPILTPMIRERLKQEEAMGPDWPERPNDLLSWILECAPPHKRTVDDLIFRIIVLNFVSVHTTSVTLTNAIFDLAAHPEYIQPLRDEMEGVIKQNGWSKDAMSKMRKLDSFVKESSRMRGIGSIAMARKVMSDFALSDGTVIPEGCTVAIASRGLHYDPEHYDNPHEFDGYRFLKMRESDEGEEMKHQMISLEHDFLLFGNGRSACPGRFFAVNEAKTIISHIVLNYDIKLPEGATSHPDPRWFSSSYLPNSAAHLVVRKRQ
ncbi:hypothetical protein D9611_001063 [Ephemerocybe angulata]|uniref:Cytochrome P450 n=1 Tax=Ephemerocybe angulata TaxID=980116 RepID=A0A8H5BQ99_9AGAR|nr:hypothetical protein D9611_001063 [Tulosesus angulatus]